MDLGCNLANVHSTMYRSERPSGKADQTEAYSNPEGKYSEIILL